MSLDTRILNLASAEEFVKRTKNARWEAWDIIVFERQPRAFMSTEGRYDRRTGRWGVEQRISPDSNGNWTVTIHKPFRK